MHFQMNTSQTFDSNETEAYRALCGMVGRKSGSIPVEVVVRHVLNVTKDMDWPVKKVACDEILKRLSFSRRDNLKVIRRPEIRKVVGEYQIGISRSNTRPYRTVIRAFDPIECSCDCPDFVRSSLGICKHALTVYEDIFSSPQKKAVAEKTRSADSTELRWNPVREACGLGDPLSQVHWKNWGGRKGKVSKELWVARKFFTSSENGSLFLKDTFPHETQKRLTLVKSLFAVSETSTIDPALRVILKREETKLRARLTNPAQILKSHLPSLKKKLFPFQRESVTRFLERGLLLIADDMGLGKTAQAIACCHLLWKAKAVHRGLLIVPASLKSQWQREWQLFTDAPVHIVDGAPAERRTLFENLKTGFLIVNYELVIRDLEVMHAWNPEFVILDEAQRIKNWETKTAAYTKTFRPRFRLILTGTPMENRLRELGSVIEWVDDVALEPRWRLVPWHSTYVDDLQEISGARNLDTLRKRLSESMIRRRREEVIAELPKRTDIRVPVQMSMQQRDEHDQFSQPILKLMAISKKRPLTQAEFLNLMKLFLMQRLIANGLVLFQFEEQWPQLERIANPTDAVLQGLSCEKLLELREIVGRIVLEQKRKVVIFSQWRRMIVLAHWAIQELLCDQGYRAAFFTGHEKEKRRTQNIVEFHDDPSLRVLFLSDAGGVGLNLQRAADCCVNLDLPWNPAVLEQRIGRIYRLGQKNPIQVFNLVAEESIESRIAAIISSKRELFSGLFDGKSDSVCFEASGTFLGTLEKLVEPVKVPEIKTRPSATDFELESAEDSDAELAEIEVSDEVPGKAFEESPKLEVIESASSFQRSSAHPSEEQIQPEVQEMVTPVVQHQAMSAPSSDFGNIFSQLEVRKTEDGRLQISAGKEASAVLATLFESLAQSLRQGMA